MSPFVEEDDFENKILEEGNDNQVLLRSNSGQLDITGLLTQVAETHDLQSVQSIKLKIMTKDLPLHSLYSYLPGLKELDLECSNINSLRELGTDLKSLQVLRLGRCRLESLDGILAFKSLKEFSAPDNYITHLGLAGQLSHLIYFDISRLSWVGLVALSLKLLEKAANAVRKVPQTRRKTVWRPQLINIIQRHIIYIS